MENDGKLLTSTLEAINKMIFDGRYQVSEHKGNFIEMPFE